MSEPDFSRPEQLADAILERLRYDVCKHPEAATDGDWFAATAHAVRDRLVPNWLDTVHAHERQDAKQVYYFSMEFLLGRALGNALLALDLEPAATEALTRLGVDPHAIEAYEPDPALGNGGLGRLAACFLDSMAAVGLPGIGYGIRYDYGMFRQGLQEGWQVEYPDYWLRTGNPWEFRRPELTYHVRFGGTVQSSGGRALWCDTEDVLAVAYDTPVPGWNSRVVNTLRLWSAESTEPIELHLFNRGEYAAAVSVKNTAENISRVLYPDDSTPQGEELRLRQEYFFVSASLQDILRRFSRVHRDWSRLADLAAVHLNDTHPALAVPELMRLLVDEHDMAWEEAWEITGKVISYTNHTLMPEALETWPMALVHRVLPRPAQIIESLNERFSRFAARRKLPGPVRERLALIDPHSQRARMGHLSVLASHRVNGVSAVHSDLVREKLFADFAALFPDRFCNVTNGVTPRRWLAEANPGLAQLVDSAIGPGWRADLGQLAGLREMASDAAFRQRFREVKAANKQQLADFIVQTTGIAVDPGSLFDVQIKRFHEYKRQLLNLLQVLARYRDIVEHPEHDHVPRTVIFAGKAASAYWMAKLIIKLVNDVAARVNNDPRVGDRLKVVFLADYGVSLAQRIIPAADLSEQISTAGTEASGTGNMKLALNGALTIGTEDGANIEIRDAVGAENIFIFGNSVNQVAELRADGYDPRSVHAADPRLQAVFAMLVGDALAPEEPERFRALHDALLEHGDHYQLLADFDAYLEAQQAVDRVWGDPEEWSRRALLNVAAMGPFSSDRAVRDYAATIWGVQPALAPH